jgi:hypothetical protein
MSFQIVVRTMPAMAQLGSNSQPGPLMPISDRPKLMRPYCGLSSHFQTSDTATHEVTTGTK